MFVFFCGRDILYDGVVTYARLDFELFKNLTKFSKYFQSRFRNI